MGAKPRLRKGKYTKAESAKLRSLRAAGRSFVYIAREMHRTPGSVEKHAERLGLTAPPAPKVPAPPVPPLLAAHGLTVVSEGDCWFVRHPTLGDAGSWCASTGSLRCLSVNVLPNGTRVLSQVMAKAGTADAAAAEFVAVLGAAGFLQPEAADAGRPDAA